MELDNEITTCTECNRELPVASFVDAKGITRKRCSSCRSYHKKWYKDGRGYGYMRDVRQRVFSQPVPEGHKRCKRCINVKPIAEFLRANGVEFRNCIPCREYLATWRRNETRNASAEKLAPRRAYSRNKARERRMEVLAAYGNKCACCGESRPEFLALDHINGGGGKHRKEIGYGGRYYSWLRKRGYPPGYRVLCHNCNMAIAFYGVCPHQRDTLHPIDRILAQQPTTGTVN